MDGGTYALRRNYCVVEEKVEPFPTFVHYGEPAGCVPLRDNCAAVASTTGSVSN